MSHLSLFSPRQGATGAAGKAPEWHLLLGLHARLICCLDCVGCWPVLSKDTGEQLRTDSVLMSMFSGEATSLHPSGTLCGSALPWDKAQTPWPHTQGPMCSGLSWATRSFQDHFAPSSRGRNPSVVQWLRAWALGRADATAPPPGPGNLGQALLTLVLHLLREIIKHLVYKSFQ